MTYQRTLTKDLARKALRGKGVSLRSLRLLLLCAGFALVSFLPHLLGKLLFPTDFTLSALLSALAARESALPPLPSLPHLLCGGLSLVLAVGLFSLLAYGVAVYHLDLWRGRFPDRRVFLSGFSHFPSVLALGGRVAVFSLLWALAALLFVGLSVELPALLLTGELPLLAVHGENPDLLQTILSLFGRVLFVLLWVSRVFRYALAFFVLADQPRFSARRCLRESIGLLSRRGALLLDLLLSFGGWLALECALLLGFQPLRAALSALFPVSVLTGAAFWLLRVLLILYLIALSLTALLFPLWLLAYLGTALAGFYDFAQSDARNRPAPPRSWQVYG